MRVVIIASALAAAAFAAEVELKWDDGVASYAANGPGIAGHTFANDFDVATLTATRLAVRKFRIYTADVWPNGVWDGMYLELYDFRGGVPGLQIWPRGGSYVLFKPSSGTGWSWYDYSLDFPLPANRFLAAADPAAAWPHCDPLMVDSNPTNRRHSWSYYGGQWAYLGGPYGYSNLMLRVVVETEASYPGVAPASWGRIKGLYY